MECVRDDALPDAGARRHQLTAAAATQEVAMTHDHVVNSILLTVVRRCIFLYAMAALAVLRRRSIAACRGPGRERPRCNRVDTTAFTVPADRQQR
jgi:hypothetical protein